MAIPGHGAAFQHNNRANVAGVHAPCAGIACVAENEEKTPWAPWRVQQGFGLDDSTVTVNVPYGMTEFFDFKNSDPELLIETWSTLTSQACGTPAAGAWLIKVNAHWLLRSPPTRSRCSWTFLGRSQRGSLPKSLCRCLLAASLLQGG